MHKDKIILVQIQLQTDTNYKSLSKQITVSFSEKEVFTNLVLGKFRDTQSRYKDFPIEGLYVRYLILSPDAPKANLKALELKLRSVKYEPLTTYNLPATLDLSKWGFLLINTPGWPATVLIRRGEHSLISVSINGNIRSVSILDNDVVSYSFTDTVLSLELDHFTRLFVDGTLVTYKNGLQILLQKAKKPALFMERLEKDSALAGPSFSAITLKLETREAFYSSELEIVSACYYDGVNYNTYFINDYEDSVALILALITDLFSQPENHGKNVYGHNFSGFDSIFILQTLAEFTRKFKIIKKEDMVISLKVDPLVEGDLDNLVSLTFLDSKSLLPAELVELGKAFGVELKGNFDQKRKDRCRTFDDFEAIRYELLKYNKLACLVLFQVLVKFS